MTTQPKDSVANQRATTDQEQSIDPLQRFWVPIEKKNLDGSWVFRTSDRQKYIRDGETGVIRSAVKKVNGKAARKTRAKARGGV